MYAFIKYNNYRKNQNFEIITVTDDLEYARKLAFNNAKNDIQDSPYKITTCIQDYYIYPKNKKIVQYMMVEVNKNKIISCFSTIYAVIELPIHEKVKLLEDIDDKLICNNYYTDSEESD